MHSKVKNLREKIKRIVTLISTLALVLNVFLPGVFLISVPVARAADGNMCQVPVDVVLIMDTSGSMAEGEVQSKCEWTEMKKVEGEGYYTWFLNIKYNVSQDWCMNVRDSFDESSPHYSYKKPTYTPATSKKINAAKDAANSFLENMGPNDQSALVSFSDKAKLEKGLSNDHLRPTGTQKYVDDLTTGGSTDIGDAIAFATQELETHNNSQAVKAMILLTDGKANKPNGDGYNENPADVQYALDMAAVAAKPENNYKIFTVGLGSNSEINETMLQDIADTTGAKYYHAPDGNGLSAIYNEIAFEVCQYGSISGCKWSDLDNNGAIDQGEPNLTDWQIILDNGTSTTTQTTLDGCYTFAGLMPGTYQISEVQQEGWVQTYPQSGSYTVEMDWDQHETGKDFGNFNLSLCEASGTPGECVADGWRDYSFSYNYEICGQDYTENVVDETCSCQSSEVSRQCVDDGQAEVNYAYNFDYCGDNYKQTEVDADCACQQIDTPGECVADGFKEHIYTYNYVYCGQEFSDNVADDSCDCLSSVLSSECIDNNLAQVIYTYNFDYCPDDYSQQEEDLSCGSEYQCDGWQDTECVDNGIREQSRTCTDQYQNSYQEIQTVPDDVCSCYSQETNRICVSNDYGYADVTYAWNYDYCGNDYVINELDSSCACVETEVPGECVSETGRSYTFTYNYDYCGIREPEIREDLTCMTPIGIQEGDIVINELMWMGSATSTSDEWIELFNTTDKDIDLSNCQLTKLSSGTEKLMLTIPLGKIISDSGYFLISHFNKDNSNIDIDADLVDNSISLVNSKLQVKLYCGGDWNNGGSLIDTADDGTGDPLAGDNETPKKSMSRKAGATDGTIEGSWCNAGTQKNWDEEAEEFGTPGAQNYCEGEEPTTGSLKVCKYEDKDGNLTTSADQILATSTAWTFNLNFQGATTTETTDTTGCTTFENLVPGDYKLSEEVINGWHVIWPDGGQTMVTVITGQTKEINFYNFQYGSISGYKFRDLDSYVSTSDYEPLADWTINLFNSTSTTTPLMSTTTDATGFYHFSNLSPDTYTLSEVLQTNWIQLSGPTSSIVILSGAHSENNNFVNYYSAGVGGEEPFCGDGIKNNDEQCDGNDGVTTGYHCTAQCVLAQDIVPSLSVGSVGGAGPFAQTPVAGLSFIYETQKIQGQNYVESIVVSNKGNIVLTYGTLTLDLPADKLNLITTDPVWSTYDSITKIATWQIPALMVGQELTFEFEVSALESGQAISEVSAIFKQASVSGSLKETIILGAGVGGPGGGIGGEEEIPIEQGGPAPLVVAPPIAPVVTGAPGEEVIAGEQVPEQGQAGPVPGAVQGAVSQPSCAWWQWLIVILLLALLTFGYHFVLRENSGSNVPLNQ